MRDFLFGRGREFGGYGGNFEGFSFRGWVEFLFGFYLGSDSF